MPIDCHKQFPQSILSKLASHRRNLYNKRPFSKFKGGRLFEGGHLLNNFIFRVGAYSRVDAYSRGALIRSNTVSDMTVLAVISSVSKIKNTFGYINFHAGPNVFDEL